MRDVSLAACMLAVTGGQQIAAFIISHHPTSSRIMMGDDHRRSIVFMSADKEESINSDDFPAWLNALKALAKWDTNTPPSYADTTGTRSNPFAIGNNNKRKSRIWEEEMSPLVAEMSGMANVEALVTLVANETESGEIDALLPDINDLKQTLFTENDGGEDETSATSIKLFPFLDNALRFDEFAKSITNLIPDEKRGMNITFDELINMVPTSDELTAQTTQVAATSPNTAAEKILQDATQRLDFLINSTSSAFNQAAFQSLILRAGKALETTGKALEAVPGRSTEYTVELVEYANGILTSGLTPLFRNYPSVKSIAVAEQKQKIFKAAEFASLSGAIYEDTIARTHAVEHSIVAQGKIADIGWMVTDSIQYEQDYVTSSNENRPIMVRTIIIRGYDASDEEVDRIRLLNVICTASPVPICKSENALVQVHEGMLDIAKKLLAELKRYIDLTSPTHKFVFTGHSIGGSLAILLMILLRNDYGASFVKKNVLRVFTFGSPPIFEIELMPRMRKMTLEGGGTSCSILDAFDLPTDIVYSYYQPLDPIARLYSQYDPLYPLIDDLGEDGYTPWVSGPTRTLRPIVKTILESWEGWPGYRDNARAKLGQDYRSVGEQFLLLPEPIRYLTDKLVSVTTQVPETDNIIQIRSSELLPALNEVFLLDTFTISYVSVAVRSFVHHFHPAYGPVMVDYTKRLPRGNERKS